MHITKTQLIYIVIILIVLYLLYKFYKTNKEYLSEINITEQIDTLKDLINTSTLEYIYQEQRFLYDYKVNILIDKDMIVFRPESSIIQTYKEDDLSDTPKPGHILIKYNEKEQKYYLIKGISFGINKLIRKIDITSNIHNLINTLKDYKIIFLPSAIKIVGADIKLMIDEYQNIKYLI